MRTKLTALIVACAALAGAVAAQAAPIPVAQYTFESQADVAAFQTLSGAKCTRKWRQPAAGTTTKKGKTTTAASGAMSLLIGAGTNACVLQSSVVADSSDTAPDQIISATVNFGGGGDAKLQKKAYEGVTLRRSATAGYELRVLPNAGKWQYFRDPKGAPPAVLVASGAGRFIKAGTKPNALSLKAFDFGAASTSLVATINGQSVVSTTDSGTDQPDGRRNGVTAGVKGTGPATGIISVFDDVTVQVRNPF
jgi:hypothetical protein